MRNFSQLANVLFQEASYAQPAFWGSLIREVAKKQERENIVVVMTEGGFRGNTKYAYLGLVQHTRAIQSDLSVYFLGIDNVVNPLREKGLPVLSTQTNWQQSALVALRAKILIRGTHDLMRADHWFWQSCFEGALKLQLWHGIPVKKGCATMLENRPDYYHFAKLLYDTYSADIVIAESAICKEAYSQDWPKAHVLAFGSPRNDILVSNDTFGELWQLGVDLHLISILEKERTLGKRVILCCPTYREAYDKSGLFLRNWFSALSNLTALPDIKVCFKAHHCQFTEHPGDEQKIMRFCMDWGVLYIPPMDDIHPYYLMSDALLTDYSSTYMDYMILKRPIIFYRPDMAEYQHTRGLRTYTNFKVEAIGPVATDAHRLREAVARELKRPSYTEEQEKFALLFHRNAKDGRATKRLCNLIESITTQEFYPNGIITLEKEEFYERD